MIENKQMRPNLIASFSDVSTGGFNSPINSSELAGMRAVRSAPHGSQFTGHWPVITASSRTLRTFLINVAAIRNVRNFQKTNNGGQF